jgi:hypothetical protein
MSEILENYDFPLWGPKDCLYPYDEWFDGQIWKISKGIDFDCTLESMRVSLFTTAKKRGIRIRTARKGDTLIFQRREE